MPELWLPSSINSLVFHRLWEPQCCQVSCFFLAILPADVKAYLNLFWLFFQPLGQEYYHQLNLGMRLGVRVSQLESSHERYILTVGLSSWCKRHPLQQLPPHHLQLGHHLQGQKREGTLLACLGSCWPVPKCLGITFCLFQVGQICSESVAYNKCYYTIPQLAICPWLGIVSCFHHLKGVWCKFKVMSLSDLNGLERGHNIKSCLDPFQDVRINFFNISLTIELWPIPGVTSLVQNCITSGLEVVAEILVTSVGGVFWLHWSNDWSMVSGGVIKNSDTMISTHAGICVG